MKANVALDYSGGVARPLGHIHIIDLTKHVELIKEVSLVQALCKGLDQMRLTRGPKGHLHLSSSLAWM